MRRLRSCSFGFAVIAVVAASSAPLVAQDTAKGVRIGLRYDPGTRPGVAVLPISGAYGDSVRAILERDAVPWTTVMFRAVFDEQPVC